MDHLLHGTLHVTVIEASSLSSSMFFIKKKIYTKIKIQDTVVGRTRRFGDNSVNPQWNESLHIYCAHLASQVVFSIKCEHLGGTASIGKAFLNVTEIIDQQEVDEWLEVSDGGEGAEIHVKLQFVDVNQDENWSGGIADNFPGVPYTFFSQRNGCNVTLYQDAHVPDSFVPKISLAEGRYYEPHRCWEDIFDAITNAKRLIYITGWSVYTEITLIRDSKRPRAGGDMTLGELLKKKASEGVRVLMLLWNDRTALPIVRNEGLMGTHDGKTASYFHGTDVHCVLCPRLGITNLYYTHHQKAVVVDSALPSGDSQQWKITSFVGGIDLCNGRYDTDSHSLFRTLDTTHKNDFYQGCIKGASKTSGDPRQPWHDIHCRLEGPVAWDVLSNFEQRWRKQGGKVDLLVDNIIPPSPVTPPDDCETWNVQLFRSIDSHAADFGFPTESAEESAARGLVSGQDYIIDRSIQDGYINAIRRAKRFIYIENQYFVGSSFCWGTDDAIYKDGDALHLIPKEVSLKIVSKINADAKFMVYIVLPMCPEGLPESKPVQAILDAQRRTIEMMYTDIAAALKVKGIHANPMDYLSFFCLGNREKSDKSIPDTASRAQKARRFMIYVHSKMMIVDDEYIIIGSANINQRSMDGGRDTEIAMGGYQPYQVAIGQRGRGQIHGFRMALWYEHFGFLEDWFLKPESLECVQNVKELANVNWEELYTKDTLENDLPLHLLRYPIGKTFDGKLKLESAYFPDTKAQVLGEQSRFIPPAVAHYPANINYMSDSDNEDHTLGDE